MKKIIYLIISLLFFTSFNSVFAQNDQLEAIIEIQSGKLTDHIPFSINLDGSKSQAINKKDLQFFWEFPDGSTSSSKNPPNYKITQEGEHKIILTVQEGEEIRKSSLTINALANLDNGDLSKEIKINELFINPKGKDSEKEWLELKNNSDRSINLGNWQIINNNKESLISKDKTIAPHSYILIRTPLKNSHNTIKLLDFQGTTIDQINYTSVKENLSLSLINQMWIWTEPTPNQANPILKSLTGSFAIKEIQPLIPHPQTSKILQAISSHTFSGELLIEKTANKNKIIQIIKNQNTITRPTNAPTSKWQYYLISVSIFLTTVIYYLSYR